MPVFDFHCAETGETISVLVRHTAPDQERHQQVQDGKVFKRVYSAPLATVDSAMRMGDGTSQEFNRVTTNKRGLKVGDLWEISRAAAEKRKDKHGFDPVQEANYKKWERENGEKHPDVVHREKLEKMSARMKEMGVTFRN